MAWREFDARYGDLILRYCRSRGLQHSDAEDVRQIVMMNLARALPGFEYSPQRGRFRSYLGRVVRNAVIHFASRPNGQTRALDSGVLATTPAPDSTTDDAQWDVEWVRHHYRLAMQTVRATFEPRSVEAFDRLLAGESVAQVAGEFSMTDQAVHKVKQRIRERLRELIAEQIRQEDDPNG